MTKRTATVPFILPLLVVVLAGFAMEARGSAVVIGTVKTGSSSTGSAIVTMYQAGDEPGGQAEILAVATADSEGNFSIPYDQPTGDRVLYVLARGGTVQMPARGGVAGHCRYGVRSNSLSSINGENGVR